MLTRIMYGYDHTGTEYALFEMVQQWGLQQGRAEADSKADYLRADWIERESQVEKRWPPSCTDLLLEFKKFLCKMNQEKMRIANKRPKEMKKAWRALTAELPTQYQIVLDLFDTAIRKIDDPNDQIPPSPGSDDLQSSSPTNDYEASSPFMISNTHTSSPFGNQQSPLFQPRPEDMNFLKRVPMGPPDDQPGAKRGHVTPTPPSRTRTPRSTLLRSPSDLPLLHLPARRTKSSQSRTLDRESKDLSIRSPK